MHKKHTCFDAMDTCGDLLWPCELKKVSPVKILHALETYSLAMPWRLAETSCGHMSHSYVCPAGKERNRKAGRGGKRSRGWGGRSGPAEQAASGNALADFAKVVKCAA